MGKPKALKQKDKNPAIKIDTKTQKGSVKFDEDAEIEINETEDIALPDTKSKAEKKNTTSDDHDDVPEEVQAESLEILELKRQLDETTMIRKSNRIKKRKQASKTSNNNEQGVEEYLDTEILANLNNVEEEEEEESESKIGRIIITKSENEKNHLRNFGNIEVQVLDQSSVENPNKRFKLSAEVANFNDLKSSKIKRAKYGAFISQRRAVPSKQFIVSSVN